MDKVPRLEVCLYIGKYESYKSTSLKLRHGLLITNQLQKTLFDLHFEGENQTTDETPFLKMKDNHLLVFASNEGLNLKVLRLGATLMPRFFLHQSQSIMSI